MFRLKISSLFPETRKERKIGPGKCFIYPLGIFLLTIIIIIIIIIIGLFSR